MWWFWGARIYAYLSVRSFLVSRVTVLRILNLVFTLVVVFLAPNNSSALTSYHHHPHHHYHRHYRAKVMLSTSGSISLLAPL